jgi:hypothetical protein
MSSSQVVSKRFEYITEEYTDGGKLFLENANKR